MNIRRAVPSDAAALAEIAERTFRETFAKDNHPDDLNAYLSQAYGESQQRSELEDPQQPALLVEDDGKLIAYAQLRHQPSEHGDLEIWRFYVDSAHHGRGIAQNLMNACFETARQRGAKTIWLGVWERNARAIAFYEKCGFHDIGSHPFMVGSDLQTDRLMQRVIESS
jgi:ribosomal protein S18 acetylase RimI-like enzyme